MTITLELPDEVATALRSQRDPNQFAAQALAAALARENALNAPARSVAESHADLRARYGLATPDANRTREQIAQATEAALTHLSPEIITEAEQQGLL